MSSVTELLAQTHDGFVRSGMVKFHADLTSLMRSIDEVSPAPWNYNNGDIEEISASIETSGMYRPIYVQRSTGHIVAGNHTWMAVKALGSEVIPVVALDVGEAEAKRIMVEDNEIAKKARPDNGLLVALLDEIAEAEPTLGLTGTGINVDELERLRKLNEIPLDTQDYAQWPTFTVQVPPHVLRAFRYMTDDASDDRTRFELLLRMAGWDGS